MLVQQACEELSWRYESRLRAPHSPSRYLPRRATAELSLATNLALPCALAVYRS